MIRAVIDTNVLISAVIRPEGRTGAVLTHLLSGHFTLVTSQAALEELVGVLARPRMRSKYGVTDDDVEALLSAILLLGELVTTTTSLNVCRDPRDDKFLEIAVDGDADLVVSGDQDLLVLGPLAGGVEIVTPAEFLNRLRASAS